MTSLEQNILFVISCPFLLGPNTHEEKVSNILGDNIFFLLTSVPNEAVDHSLSLLLSNDINFFEQYISSCVYIYSLRDDFFFFLFSDN